jgi:hypothetical protein
MDNITKNLMNQALHAPIEDLALVETHIRLVSSTLKWSDVAILIDEDVKAILILLLHDDHVQSILRFCLSVDDSVKAIECLAQKNGRILFGSYQGNVFSQEEIQSIEKINIIWSRIQDQITEFTLENTRDFFDRIEKNSKKIGRGDSFSADTKRKVMLDSHGRCMFAGCGGNLGIEGLTNTEGNFSYLAHNIASSEQGARGVIALSEKLSDDPENILLLCDKHHRLIDKVAAANYPAYRLSEMRREFCAVANKLLDGLGYQPIPVFSVLWPVHRQVISAPSNLQIAQSLASIRCRMHSQLNDISDNEAILRETNSEVAQQVLIHSVSITAEKILNQTHASRYRAGLFAFGLMPYLIALGAMLGNKNNITPMLKYRDSGQWCWPLEKPIGNFYSISGLEDLADSEDEVIITLALTAEPESLIRARQEVAESIGAKQIIIKAYPEYMGNGAVGHPEDGQAFTSSMQLLMHDLRDKKGVNRIYLFPCASNAACIFFGQAFDSHHADMLVYDFCEQSMKPILSIVNSDNKCVINNIK